MSQLYCIKGVLSFDLYHSISCLFYRLVFFLWRTKTAHWNTQQFGTLLLICLLILLY